MVGNYQDFIDDWRQWIMQVCEELTTLDLHDKLVGELNQIIADNPVLMEENPLSGWMNRIHAGDVALRIRRQVDGDRNAMSLRRLLEKLQPHASKLLEAYLSDLPEGVSEESAREFVCGIGRQELDLGAENVMLIEKTKSVVCYADRVIAHADKRGMPQPPTWAEVHAAVEVVIECAERCYLLLTGNQREIRFSTPLNIRVFFREPWVIEV